MSLKGKEVFVRKTSGGGLYKWAPDNTLEQKKFKEGVQGEFCTAIAHAVKGEDKITKYVVRDGITTYHAYVACNYVK
jgi:hypothetical protein